MLLLLAVPATATEPPPAQFHDTLEVRAVQLEVVVTDRRGVRVTGLGPEDFRVFVDGEEVTVDAFAEIVEGRVRMPGEGGVTVEGAPAGDGGDPDLGEAVARSFLVFIDEFFSTRLDRDAVVRSLAAQLDHLEPGDRMAIVAYDGTGLKLLTHWSSSRAELERGLEEALGRPAHGLNRALEQSAIGGGRHPSPLSAGGAGGIPGVATVDELILRRAVRDLETQLRRAVGAAAAALGAFAEAPGRRVLLLLAGAWPFDAGVVLTGLPTTELDDIFTDGEELYGPLADTAGTLGVTIFGVDVPASSGPLRGHRGELATLDENEFRAGFDPRQTLDLLSRRTGGEALVSIDRSEALARAAADTRTYYSLGFTPIWRRDDASRRVRVEVAGSGLTVRARTSLGDFSPERSTAMLLQSALHFDTPPRPHTVTITLGEPARVGRREVEVPLAVEIPVDGLSFLPAAEGLVAELELRLAVRGASGDQRADLPAFPVRLAVATAPPPGTTVRYETTVRLRRERHRIAVTVRDQVGGALLTGAAAFEP